MNGTFVAVGLWISLALSGCAAPGLETYQPRSADEAAIVSAIQKIPNGIKAGSVEMIVQPYADDVYVGNFQKYLGVAGPSAPLSVTKADLRTIYQQVLRSAKQVSMQVKDFRVVSLTSDRAVVEASTELVFKIEAGRGERKEDAYRNGVTWRLRRTPGGWKIVEEIWE
jgi:ketosteroid isomerase-like protein